MDGHLRTFVAIFPPPAVAEAVDVALAPLRAPGDGIAWVRPQNLHFTLRFLGPLAPADVAAAAGALADAAQAPGVAPVPVRLGGPGVFPGPARPRVLWLGAAEGAAALVHLAAAVETALDRERFARAERPFTPHLTLGRVREAGRGGATLEAVRAVVARFLAAPFPDPAFTVGEIALVTSRLAAGGSRYEPIARAALGGRPAGDPT